MYLAQDILNPSLLDSLGKISPLGLLCFVVVAFIWLVIKLNSNTSKNTDVTQKVVDVQQQVAEGKAADNQTFIDAIANLTKIAMSLNDRQTKNDTTVEIMVNGIKEQNDILNGILGFQQTGNEFSRKVFEELITISGDQSTALTAVGQSITKQVEGTEQTIMARLDNMPERVASRLTPALATQHTQTLQTITSSAKSVEDLFKVIIQENVGLRDEVELKNQTITALNTQLEMKDEKLRTANAEIARLTPLSAPSDFETLPPDDPDPVLPDGSGAKQPIPGDFEPQVALPKASGEERAA